MSGRENTNTVLVGCGRWLLVCERSKARVHPHGMAVRHWGGADRKFHRREVSPLRHGALAAHTPSDPLRQDFRPLTPHATPVRIEGSECLGTRPTTSVGPLPSLSRPKVVPGRRGDGVPNTDESQVALVAVGKQRSTSVLDYCTWHLAQGGPARLRWSMAVTVHYKSVPLVRGGRPPHQQPAPYTHRFTHASLASRPTAPVPLPHSLPPPSAPWSAPSLSWEPCA